MEAVLIAVCGFVAGQLIVKQVLQWIALLSAATTKQGGDYLGPPRRRLLWVAPFVVILHPGLYIISALVIITAFYVLSRLHGEWGWFLLGLYIYVILVGLSIASRYRRVRRSQQDSETRAH